MCVCVYSQRGKRGGERSITSPQERGIIKAADQLGRQVWIPTSKDLDYGRIKAFSLGLRSFYVNLREWRELMTGQWVHTLSCRAHKRLTVGLQYRGNTRQKWTELNWRSLGNLLQSFLVFTQLFWHKRSIKTHYKSSQPIFLCSAGWFCQYIYQSRVIIHSFSYNDSITTAYDNLMKCIYSSLGLQSNLNEHFGLYPSF